MKIKINNSIYFENCSVANNFFQKLFGILTQKPPLLIKNCNSIHTIFLKKNITAIFIDKNGEIVEIKANIPPNKIILPIKKAVDTIEFDTQVIKSAKINVGDIIEFE